MKDWNSTADDDFNDRKVKKVNILYILINMKTVYKWNFISNNSKVDP